MRRCLWCGSLDNLTRDHVVAKVQLRLALGQERYAQFCSQVRKLNIQTLCSTCNNDKGDHSCDLRGQDIAIRLVEALEEFKIDDVIEWTEPSKLFTREEYKSGVGTH